MLPKPKFKDFVAEVAGRRNKFDLGAGAWKGALNYLLAFMEGTDPVINEIDDLWLMSSSDS